jgi:hypothetical protein
MQLKIHNLTKNVVDNFSIQIRHIRPNVFIGKGPNKRLVVSNFGGITAVAVLKEGYGLPRIFMSKTHPDDSFCNKTGTFWALVEMVRTTYGYLYGVDTYEFEDNGRSLVITIKELNTHDTAENYNCSVSKTL